MRFVTSFDLNIRKGGGVESLKKHKSLKHENLNYGTFFQTKYTIWNRFTGKKTSKRGQTHGKILWNKDWNVGGGGDFALS
jgi:hypothetical protein